MLPGRAANHPRAGGYCKTAGCTTTVARSRDYAVPRDGPLLGSRLDDKRAEKVQTIDDSPSNEDAFVTGRFISLVLPLLRVRRWSDGTSRKTSVGFGLRVMTL